MPATASDPPPTLRDLRRDRRGAHRVPRPRAREDAGRGGTLIVWLFAMRILMIITSLVSYAINDRYATSRYGDKADFNPEAPLTSLVWITSILSIGVTFVASDLLLGDFPGSGALWWVLSIIISCGTLAGAIIPEFTKIFTSPHSATCKRSSTRPSTAARRSTCCRASSPATSRHSGRAGDSRADVHQLPDRPA